jgi:photosystem II stability/assembly factor-like uncharacterized protein
MSARLLLGTTDGIWSSARDGRDAAPLALAGQAITQLVEDRHGALYATDGRQIWRGTDSWRGSSAARLPGDQSVTVLAVSPHAPYPLFAGSIPAALFRSDDAGSTWQEVPGFTRCPGRESWTFPGPSPLPRVNAVAFDARDAACLYATVEVGGILRSRDGGGSWENCSEQVNRDGHFLAAHPQHGGVLYASAGFGSGQPGGIYRSDDHGSTWQYRFAGLTPAYTRPLVLDQRAHDLLYVAATPQQPPYWALPEGPGSVLWRGERGGEAWTIVFPDDARAGDRQALVSALAVDPATDGALYFACSEVAPVLHAIGALGRSPGGPFPPPAQAPVSSAGGADEIVRARRQLQQQLSALDGTHAPGHGEIWHLEGPGAARRLAGDLPAVLSILPQQR